MGLKGTLAATWTLTVDIEAVTVQSVVAHPGDTMSQLAQLLVQLFSVQPRTCGVRMVGADGIHSSCCSILFSPRMAGTEE